MTEALKIQLDNVTRELQALQVENARLREANPELASGIDAERKELEENSRVVHVSNNKNSVTACVSVSETKECS